MKTLSGLDIFLRQTKSPWRRLRAGAILHQASVTRNLVPATTALHRYLGKKLVRLFAPEHGLAGTLQDQAAVRSQRDPLTGLPVFSLYGPRRQPTPAMLKGLDLLIFDLQDIGTRYYTFIWTMALAMHAAARAKIPFLVLDRPNPLGGILREGDMVDPRYSSFVGLFPLPVRHGMTMGELALWFNHRHGIGCDVHVIPIRGWRRDQWFDQTGLPWVMPSPNMPTLDTATVYPGMCLLEATTLSEGRGATRPFEIMGAPFIDPPRLAGAMNDHRLPGAAFRPLSFLPTFNKYAGALCHGVQTHVTDRNAFQPYRTGLVLLQTVHRLWPRRFRWKHPPYEFETRLPPMDILCGSDRPRRAIDDGASLAPLARAGRRAVRAFTVAAKPFFLYE
jgi:uncharacterized protein YbbC (DUF1343 family)